MELEAGYCYLFVKGWKAGPTFVDDAEAACDNHPDVRLVLVDVEADWPPFLPDAGSASCAEAVCACPPQTPFEVACTAGQGTINLAIIQAKAACQ